MERAARGRDEAQQQYPEGVLPVLGRSQGDNRLLHRQSPERLLDAVLGDGGPECGLCVMQQHL